MPDGYYNIQFKIYQDGDGLSAGDSTGSPAGALKWTESYLNANSQGVQVINGYMSVQLGSITPFGANIDWNQSTLWLSMNIGGTNTTCTPFTSCTPDGEMLPMKRLSSSPYALNSGLLGGLSSSQFIQFSPSTAQTDSTNNNSVYLNRLNSGNFINFQYNGSTAIAFNTNGDFLLGSGTDHNIYVYGAGAGSAGHALTIYAGAGGTGASPLGGGTLTLQGGAGGGTNGVGGSVLLDGGAGAGTGAGGNVNIGTSYANVVQIGNTGISSGTQTINIGNANTSGGTTNVTVGNSSGATAGTTAIQAKTAITISTNGVTGATFDNASNLYLGNGVTAASPNNFAIRGTGSTTTATAGGALTIQGGNATVGNANGGNVTIAGGTGIGTGVNGLVVLTTPTFSTIVNDANCYNTGALVAASCTIASSSVNTASAVLVGFSTAGNTATLPNPTNTTAGRILYVTGASGSNDFTLSVNGGGTGNTIAMKGNTSATMIWNGSAWTAAGATSTQYVQFAPSNYQTDSGSGTNTIYLNKTGTGNFLSLQSSGTNVAAITNTGDYLYGNSTSHSLSVATSAASNSGQTLTVSAGNAGTGAAALGGGTLTLQGGAGGGTNGAGGNISVDGGAGNGTGAGGIVNIGATYASTINVGNASIATGTQTINVGIANAAGGTTNVTVGNGGSALAGTTTIQAKTAITINTNGTPRAYFDNSNNLFLGNGVLAAAPTNFAIIGTSSSTAGVAAGSLVMQGGNAVLGNTNGGNVTIQGGNGAGSGSNGVVILTTPVFSTTLNDANCYTSGALVAASCTIATSSVNNSSAIVVGFSTTGQTATLPNPTITTAGRVIYITGASGSSDFTLSVNGGGAGNTIILKANTSAAMIWNGSAWTAAGATSTQYVQFTPSSAQVDATGNSSIFINKTSSGNFINLQYNGNSSVAFNTNGDLVLGNSGSHQLYVNSTASTAGQALTVFAGGAGSGASALGGGTLTLQGGAGGGTNGVGGNVVLDSGAGNGTGAGGNINIGTNYANTIQIGNTSLAGGTQTINIGNANTSGGTTNVTIGNGGSATGGTTSLQAKTAVTVSTNGTQRAYFDNANNLYLGNGVAVASPSNFAIVGTSSTTSAVSGANLTIQGGSAIVGSANGGNVILNGGAGVGTGTSGLVVLSTPTVSTILNDANCYTSGALVGSSCTIAATSVNNASGVIVGFSNSGQTATLPNPTNTTAGRILYVMGASGSSDFTLSINGGGSGNTITVRANASATLIWNGSAWTPAAATNTTTLQTAYNSTLQATGSADILVSKTTTNNGLTVRDSTTNGVNGAVLSVQTASAAGLFSVNDNITDYSSDGGAEVAGASSSTFPATTWAAVGGSTVSRYTTAGNNISTGQASVATTTTTAANDGVKDTLSSSLNAGIAYNVSFTARLASGTLTDMNVYYSVDGTTASVACKTGQSAISTIWTKVTCNFTAPSSGITSSNAILIRQTSSGTARTFYLDNLSITTANTNYATDGNVDDSVNFATNWNVVGSGATLTRSTTVGYNGSDSAQIVAPAIGGPGVRNKLSANLQTSTAYRVTVYVASTTSGFTGLTIRYSRDGGTTFASCTDYNTQTVSSSTASFNQVTCNFVTDATTATSPYLYIQQLDATARTFYVDALSVNLSANTAPSVQIGGGATGGPATLLTLDSSASAPASGSNGALFGSMYYDTTIGKIQCYQANGWGACGSSPDTVVTLSPEFTNAVLHGTGIGTMTSDFCSSASGININDGTSGQATICGTNETYNFYKWTSPQATAQTYSIYVTYQLPNSFNNFNAGFTSLKGRTDSTNSTVQYQIYRNDASSGLSACGSAVSVSTGSVSSWQTGVATGSADPASCGFIPGNSILFKINVTASLTANAYVSNLNFTFSNK